MPYDKDRDVGPNGHPSLSEMVTKAIDVLSRNQNGFVLIVSGKKRTVLLFPTDRILSSSLSLL